MAQAEQGSEIRRDHKKRKLQKIIEAFLNHEDLITIPKAGAGRTVGNSANRPESWHGEICYLRACNIGHSCLFLFEYPLRVLHFPN